MIDRLVAGFLVDPAASLVAPDRVLTGGGQTVAIIDDTERLAGLYADPTVQHVVIVGDGPAEAPTHRLGRSIGVHRVDASGRVERISRPALPELGVAVAASAAAPPLTPELVAERQALGAQRAGDLQRLATALRARFPWVTTAIAAVCVVLFGLGELWGHGDLGRILVRMGANGRQLVAAGQPWRVLSSAFLHLNVEHLVVNMWALLSFGILLERLLGARRYLVLYGLSALGGGIASALLGKGISVGASGAIWGLMTAGIALALRPRGLLPPSMLARARRTAVWPLVINVLYSFTPGIDLFAHFGGGLVGFLLMLSGAVTAGVEPAWKEVPAAPRRASPLVTIVAGLIAVAAAGSIALALASGRPWALGEPPRLRTVALGDSGVSIDVPDTIAGSLQRQARLTSEIFDYVVAGEPIGVELVVGKFAHEVDNLDAELAVVGKALEGAKLDGAKPLGPASMVNVGAHRFVTVSYRFEQASMQCWVTMIGGRQVVLRVYRFGDLPSGWAAIPEQIVTSLR